MTKSPPPRRTLLTAAILALIPAVYWIAFVPILHATGRPLDFPFWIYFPICLCCSFLTVDISFGRGHATGSISEAAILIGLYTVSPFILLPCYVVSEFAVAWLHRRPSLLSDSLNLGTVLGAPAAAYTVFALWQPDTGHPLAPLTVLAAVTATVAASMTSTVFYLIGLASLHRTISWRATLGLVTYQQVLVVTGVPLALILLTFSLTQPYLIVLLVPLVAVVVGGQRASAASAQRAQRTNFLYRTATLLHSTVDLTESARELMSGIVDSVSCTRAELTVALEPLAKGSSPESALRFRYDAIEGSFTRQSEPLREGEWDLTLEAQRMQGVVASTRHSSPLMERYRVAVGARTVAVAALSTPRRTWGTLSVSNPSTNHFAKEELVLLGTLGGEIALALERGKLAEAVQEMSAERQELVHMGLHDQLTGLGNRALFGERLHSAWERMDTQHKLFAVLYLDLDGFKQVNDTLGHGAGDVLLSGVADRLMQQIRKPDTAARLGGDEFAILLEEVRTPRDAELVAQRILESLRFPFSLPGGEGRVRGSIGIAIGDSSTTAADEAELLHHADLAMYRAKEAGKDRFTVYSESAPPSPAATMP